MGGRLLLLLHWLAGWLAMLLACLVFDWLVALFVCLGGWVGLAKCGVGGGDAHPDRLLTCLTDQQTN